MLVNGFPEFGRGETPLVFTGPHCLAMFAGTFVSLLASERPLAPADVAGTNMARDDSAATASKPAGKRSWLRTVLVNGVRTPRMPT